MPMVQMAEATQYLGDRMTEVTPELEKMIKRDPEQYGWIEEAVDTSYFQLRTDNRHHSEDVEYLSSKTVVRGVQLIIVYVVFVHSNTSISFVRIYIHYLT